MNALELEVGHIVQMRTGPVVVLRVSPARAGVEMLVRPAAGRDGQGTGTKERILWFGAQQRVEVAPEKQGVEVSISPGRAQAARAAHARRVQP